MSIGNNANPMALILKYCVINKFSYDRQAALSLPFWTSRALNLILNCRTLLLFEWKGNLPPVSLILH
jgi:hypothetical protein